MHTYLGAGEHQTAELYSMGLEPLTAERLERAKRAYSIRRVPLEKAVLLRNGTLRPRPGDLVLARVLRPRQHGRLELADGRRAQLFVGDEIVVCYGNRYAPDQFESEVPRTLEQCHLVAGGGIASRVISRHARMKPATEIEPIGLLGDARGRRLNLADFALPVVPEQRERPLTIAVVGTAMNAGKTTAAAHLVRGLTEAGYKVGAAKVTGTGAGCDRWFMQDAGAYQVLDFTDAGYASTYKVEVPELENIAESLCGNLAQRGAEVLVLEVADGLFQVETAALLGSPRFRNLVDGVFFAAGDAMGALGGVLRLERYGLPVLGVGGLLTTAPLAVREAEQATGQPVLTSEKLASRHVLDHLGLGAIGALDMNSAVALQ